MRLASSRDAPNAHLRRGGGVKDRGPIGVTARRPIFAPVRPTVRTMPTAVLRRDMTIGHDDGLAVSFALSVARGAISSFFTRLNSSTKYQKCCMHCKP